MSLNLRVFSTFLFCVSVILGATNTASTADKAAPDWEMSSPQNLDTCTVSLSKPVLVARSHDYLWFPNVKRLSGGELFAIFSTNLDAIVPDRTASMSWSADGGRTWSGPYSPDPAGDLYAEATLTHENGDELLYPFNMYPHDGGMRGLLQVVPGAKGNRQVELVQNGVTLTGLPRPDSSFNASLGLSGFGFNGPVLRSTDGGYLATLYGYFANPAKRRYSLILAESPDGRAWTYRTTIARDDCPLADGGGEGPCEVAVCRLKDQRLMCVFRISSGLPLGQCFSSDEGRTWTEPVSMKSVHSVQPSVQVLKNGAVALASGRPGLYLWINRAGDGKAWDQVDIQQHHNALISDEPIEPLNAGTTNRSTCYSKIVTVGDSELLYVYDRIPHGWDAIPENAAATNSIWAVRVKLDFAH